MPFKWEDFLNFAQFVEDNRPLFSGACLIETLQRNTVSRAYYAAFCYARYYAEAQRGQPFGRNKTHKQVQDYYFSKQRWDIHDKLKDMGLWRTQCDYDNNVNNLQTLINDSLLNARYIFQHL